MPVSLSAQLGGDQVVADALEAAADPRVITRALRRGGRELKAEMRLHVSGPRPRRLDVVTGELRGSFRVDEDDLPRSIVVGTPLLFAEVWEIGKGRRKARPFAQPALDVVAARMPDIFIDELERARDSIS